jgi:hypothetical protein
MPWVKKVKGVYFVCGTSDKGYRLSGRPVKKGISAGK